MKLHYLWLLPEAIMLFWFMIPIYKRICNPGNLSGILVCVFCIFVTIFPQKFVHLIRLLWSHLAGKIGLSVLALILVAGILFCSMMSVQMGRAIASHTDEPQTVVVLGCKVKGTKPSAMLTRRLEAALEYLEENEEVMCITTGGQGSGEDIPEGQAMKTWLVEHGIDELRILVEDTSTDTRENLENAAAILEENELGTEVTIITNGFHQYRTSLLAEQCGLTAYAYSAYTNPLYVPTYWVREWMALFELFFLS